MLLVKFNVPSAHTGELLLAIGFGKGFTTTLVVAVIEQLLASVTVTEKIPEKATVAVEIVGFCKVELNEFGPDQMYDVPFVVKVNVTLLPEQTGLLVTIEAVGKGLNVTFVVAEAVQLLSSVTVTV